MSKNAQYYIDLEINMNVLLHHRCCIEKGEGVYVWDVAEQYFDFLSAYSLCKPGAFSARVARGRQVQRAGGR